MTDILNNPWVVGTGVTIAGGLVLYYLFGIGKKQVSPRINESSFVTANGDITARDIIINPKSNGRRSKGSFRCIIKRKKLLVTESGPKNLSLPLPVPIPEIKKISTKASLAYAENIKWRVGYIFSKNSNPTSDFFFHIFQDPGSDSFHSRIVERREGVGEVMPDIVKTHLGVEDTKNFEFSIENKNSEIYFYVDRMPLGHYSVPINEISDIKIRGWSHRNSSPVTVIVEDVRIWY